MAVYWYRSVLLYFSMNGLISVLLEYILRQSGILDWFVWTTLSTGERWFRCRVCRHGKSLECFQKGWLVDSLS